MPPKTKAKIVKDVTQLVLARRTRMCNFLEYKGVLTLFPRLHIHELTEEMGLGRLKSRIPPICLFILCMWDWVWGQ